MTGIRTCEFYIEEVFQITGRGCVFAGRILNGIISVGNQIEFHIDKETRVREIIGVEEIRDSEPDKVNLGLTIKCRDEEEIRKLKDWKSENRIARILNNKMTFKETVEWLSTKSIKEKIEFCELLLSEMTIMNRAIWDDPETSDKTKIECLKWSNELAHRIWNLLFDMKRGESDSLENKLGDSIEFYRKQTKELAGHLGATLKGTINRFNYIKDSNNAPQQ